MMSTRANISCPKASFSLPCSSLWNSLWNLFHLASIWLKQDVDQGMSNKFPYSDRFPLFHILVTLREAFLHNFSGISYILFTFRLFFLLLAVTFQIFAPSVRHWEGWIAWSKFSENRFTPSLHYHLLHFSHVVIQCGRVVRLMGQTWVQILA